MDSVPQLTYVDGPNPARDDEIVRRLQALNRTYLPAADDDTPLEIYALDSDGSLVAGIVGRTGWGWLHVSALWVDESFRGRGIGTELMRRAEERALARGCTAARIGTWDFQAPDFYRRLGYTEF